METGNSSLRIRKLQVLYDNEINFSLSTFWDGGFDWKLGDNVNGYISEGTTHTPEEAIECIWDAALSYFLKHNDELRRQLLYQLYQTLSDEA